MQNVLVTGANRGVGLALVEQYAQRGDRVFAACRNPAGAQALNALAAAAAEVHVVELSVADADSVANLTERIDAEHLDVLINNAGTGGPPPAEQSATGLDEDGWLETFQVNTIAPVRLVQTLRPLLAKAREPKAVTITSQMGALGLDMAVRYAYCASKAAVNKVMRLMASDLKKDNVAVALIHPGWVRTDMGGPGADISAEESARGIVDVIDAVGLADSPCFKTWEGRDHVW